MSDNRLILGSASPRRRMLLAYLGIPFEVVIADVDEDVIIEPDPAENVRLRARLKGLALREMCAAPSVVLTADTSVSIDGELLNKPGSEAEARGMLERLRGRTHQVYTAVVLTDIGIGVVDELVIETDVLMRSYTDDEIDMYISTGDPFDKAGSYAIQHPTFRPVAELRGCYSSVVGLPVCQVAKSLRRNGFLVLPKTYQSLWQSTAGICSCALEVS